MSKLQCRGSIAPAAVVVALLWAGAADAQIGVAPPPPRPREGLLANLLTGSEFEIVNQATGERHLQKLQAKLCRDGERGHSVAASWHARRIENIRYRIVVDEWLIRKNTLCDSGYFGSYPYPLRMDPMTCAAISQYRLPPQVP